MGAKLTLLLALLLPSCGTTPAGEEKPQVLFIEGYYWTKDLTGKHPCALTHWIHVPADQDESGFWYGHNDSIVAFVMNHEPGQTCSVIAKVNEEQSHFYHLPWTNGYIMMPGEVVWDHEARHWSVGLVHPS